MKLRKHKGNKHYKITWSQRTPRVIETHVGGGGKSERMVTGGELLPRQAVYTTGQNPTATLNAFLFGRDRYNIQARIEECAAPDERPVETQFPTTQQFKAVARGVMRRNPRSVLGLMAAIAGISMGLPGGFSSASDIGGCR